MTTLERLQILIEANTGKFHTQIQGVGAALKGIQKHASLDKLSGKLTQASDKTGQWATKTRGASLVAAGAIGASVMSADKYNKAMAEVVTLTGKSGKEADAAFTQFGSGVDKVSQKLGLAKTELTSGLYQALSAGVPEDNAFTFLETAGKLGVAGVTDTETAIDGLTTVINAYGKKSSEAGQVSDVMFAAMKNGKMTVEQMSDSLFQVAPMASTLGVSFENVAAGMATLTSKGTPASVATTQMRAALTSLAAPLPAMTDAFKDMGVNGFDELLKREGSMQAAFQAIAQSANGDVGALKNMMGSVEGVNAVLGMTGGNAKDAQKHLKNIGDSAGSVAVGFDEVNKVRGLDRFKASAQRLGIVIGNKVLPTLTKLADKAVVVIDKMSAADSPIGGVAATLLVLGAAISPVLWGLSKMFMFGVKLIDFGIKFGRMALLIGKHAFTIGRILLGLATPFGLVVTVAVIAAVLIIKNWDRVKKFVGAAMTATGKIIGKVWDGIKKATGVVVGGIVAYVKMHFNILRTVVTLIFKGIKLVVMAQWNAMRAGVRMVSNLLVSGVKIAFRGLSAVVNVVKSIGAGIYNAFRNAGSKVVSVAAGIVSGIWGKFQGLVGKLAQVGSSAGAALGNALKSAVNAVLDKIRGFKLPSISIAGKQVPGSGATPFSGIPRLAKGGLAHAPTLAMVGDNPGARTDPEVISPLSKLEAMISRSVGGGQRAASQIVVQITGNTIANDMDINRIAERLVNRLRLMGAY